MLIFILYDYRHNPTQDFMGLHFNLPQPKVAMWIKVLDPLRIEHTIASIKIFRKVKETFRGRLFMREDNVMLVACALHNLKLNHKFA